MGIGLDERWGAWWRVFIAKLNSRFQGGVIGELDESDRASGIRGEITVDGEGATSEIFAGQASGGKGTVAQVQGVDGFETVEIGSTTLRPRPSLPNRSTMNRNQWRRFKKIAAAKLQGRK